jgi:precorrin-6A/cobalt-precorrin-6A reductase
MKRIWLIGGTSESAAIAHTLAECNLACIVTVTTSAARSLYPLSPTLAVDVADSKKCRPWAIFCQQNQIAAIVDASHPYAEKISQSAIATAQALQLPYLRYERPQVNLSPSDDTAIVLDSFETLVNGDYLLEQRVLLTVGYQALPLFKPWQSRAVLYARLLPAVNSLEVALSAGFSSDRLIALRPPISAELEKALWQQWQISLVVTKASGAPGGEEIKRSVAAGLGIPLIVVARPKIVYPKQTQEMADVLAFCCQHLAN